MLKFLLSLLVAIAPVVASAQSLSARSLSETSVRDVAYVSQTYLLTNTTNTEFTIAPLTVSNQGFSSRKMGVRLPVAPITMPLPVLTANPMDQGQALREAGYWVINEFQPFRQRMAAWMREKNLSYAYFSFSQEVNINTEVGPRKREISFTATLDSAGRATHGVPKLVDADPLILEAMYTPLQTADGLPPDWQYPEAGTLKWRLLNKDYLELTPWRTIDVAGAYDSPDYAEGVGVDPLVRIPCLVDRAHPSCGQPATTVRDLMDQTGAVVGILNYIRRIEPFYEESDDDEVAPKSTISVDERIWNCSVLQNNGRFGMEIALQADQFLVEPSTVAYSYRKVGEFGGKALSPTSNYNVALPAADLAPHTPDQVILAPVPSTDDKFWLRTDAKRMEDVVYVAPLEVKTGNLSGFVSAADVSVVQTINSGGLKEFLIGTIADNYWGGSYYPYDRNVYFNVDDPSGLQEAAIVELGFDDWLLLSVNGTTIYVGAHGGNTLESAGTGTRERTCSQFATNRWQCYRYEWIDHGDSGTSVLVPTNQYDWCMPVNMGDSDNGEMDCANGCYLGYIQYVQGAVGSGPGCGYLDQAVDWRFSPYIDIRPYLRPGQNHIFARTFVGGKGEMWFRLRVRGCEL